jgi:ACR3 family arsenite efflux pump ArsB
MKKVCIAVCGFLLFGAALEGFILSTIWVPDTGWMHQLLTWSLLPVVLLLMCFLDCLWPGSISWYRKKSVPPDAQTIKVIAIVAAVVIGAYLGTFFLPLPVEVPLFAPPLVVYSLVIWGTWYTWVKRGKVPVRYYEDSRTRPIRLRGNTPIRRRTRR